MLNSVALLGRITADPELKTTQNGISYVNFTIAVSQSYLTNGERKADFIDINAWRGTAEFICNYFSKGQMIAIEGRLQTRLYTDNEGKTRKSVNVLANSAYFAGEKRKKENAPAEVLADATDEDFEEIDVFDDLPF
jgi:single-strand DNA-binding protein